MKTLLLTIALMGFITVGGYAKDKDCPCKKAVHHKAISYHRAAKPKALCNPPTYTVLRTGKVYEEPCYTYRKHNIVVTQCPSVFYNNSDAAFEFNGSNTYMGNYPTESLRSSKAEEMVAPQHTTIDHYQGVAPAGGNGCNGPCSAQ